MDSVIKWSAVAAVALLAGAAGKLSFGHALDVVRLFGVRGADAYIYPGTVDGLIYMSSMVLLSAARRQVQAPRLAWGVLVLGILVTGAVNAWAGLPHGIGGAVVYAWPALALVLSYELLMLLIRGAAQQHSETPETQVFPVFASPVTPAAPEPAAAFGGIRSDQVPSIRAIMKERNVGYPKAKEHQAALLNGAGA